MTDPAPTGDPVRRVRTSAPGKAILVGEHAAVYGHPAVVAALPVRVEVEVEVELAERPGGGGVVLDKADGPPQNVPWSRLYRLRDEAAGRWLRYDQLGGDFEPLSRIVADLEFELDDPAVDAFVLVAIGEAMRWLTERDRPPPSAEQLRIGLRSAIPLGAGCGSSAAVACSVTAAVLAAHDVRLPSGACGGSGAALDASWDDLQQLAQEVERRQHGRPSGVDVATVLRGGVLMARLAASGSFEYLPLAASAGLLRAFRAVLTGRRPESTGEVVSAVGRRLSDPRRGRQIAAALEELGQISTDLAELLRAERIPGEPTEASALLLRAQQQLETLGIVPAPVARWLGRLHDEGVAGKVSGAGSLRGPGAGLVLLFDPEGRADRAITEAGYEDLGAGLGGAGLRIESVS